MEDVDKAAKQAADAGATLVQPPTDMFWGDRTAMLVDSEGNKWMLATHKSEPTPEQMDAAMKKQMVRTRHIPAAPVAAPGSMKIIPSREGQGPSGLGWVIAGAHEPTPARHASTA